MTGLTVTLAAEMWRTKLENARSGVSELAFAPHISHRSYGKWNPTSLGPFPAPTRSDTPATAGFISMGRSPEDVAPGSVGIGSSTLVGSRHRSVRTPSSEGRQQIVVFAGDMSTILVGDMITGISCAQWTRVPSKQ